MIEVKRTPLGFTTEGHADYAIKGQDIVCAAVSTLFQTAALGLNSYCECEISLGDGNAVVEIIERNRASDIIINTMVKGLRAIEKKHPNNLKVRWY